LPKILFHEQIISTLPQHDRERRDGWSGARVGGGASWLEKYLCKENEARRSLMSRCTTSILQICIRRRNGMELPINTVVMLSLPYLWHRLGYAGEEGVAMAVKI